MLSAFTDKAIIISKIHKLEMCETSSVVQYREKQGVKKSFVGILPNFSSFSLSHALSDTHTQQFGVKASKASRT